MLVAREQVNVTEMRKGVRMTYLTREQTVNGNVGLFLSRRNFLWLRWLLIYYALVRGDVDITRLTYFGRNPLSEFVQLVSTLLCDSPL